MQYFVCSDPHSYTSIMQDALHDAGWRKFKEDQKIIICGDIFDRGPEPIEMYRFLRGLGDKLIFVRGNHEDLLHDATREFITTGRVFSSHHWHNGTDKTVYTFNREGILDEVLNWIDEKSVDFYETDKYVFVHGWIPCQEVDKIGYTLRTVYIDDWRDPEIGHGSWFDARWLNGMKMWNRGIRIPDKTIVCGHWHCGYGNCLIHGEQTSERDEEDEYYLSDHPFIDEGIIALDSCTALTKTVNVIKLED